MTQESPDGREPFTGTWEEVWADGLRLLHELSKLQKEES